MSTTVPRAIPPPSHSGDVSTATPPVSSALHLAELDGVRGLAVMFILIWHCLGAPLHPAYAITGLESGFLTSFKLCTIVLRSGVDLFFVLSGTLIGGILLDHRASPRYFGVFYGRRAVRILPLYGLLLLTFIAAKAAGAHGRLFDGPIPTWAYATFLQNYVMTHLNTSGALWMAATWSLAVEEQFYAGFPLLVRYVAVRWLPAIFIVGIVTAPLLRIWTYRHYGTNHPAYVWLPCRVDALFLGALLALALRRDGWREWLSRHRRSWLRGFAVATLGFVGLGWALARDMDYHMTMWGHTFLAYYYAGAILLAVLYAGSSGTRLLRAKALVGLGLISYGVYLFHQPILFLVFAFFSTPVDVSSLREEALVWLALALTLGFCTLSYLGFERRLVRWGHRWRY